MAFFIWFDNDNLDYGGIGVVEYGNDLNKIVAKRRPVQTGDTANKAENDNPPPAHGAVSTTSLYGMMEPAVAAEGER